MMGGVAGDNLGLEQMVDNLHQEVYDLSMAALKRARRTIDRGTPAAADKMVNAVMTRVISMLGDSQAAGDQKALLEQMARLTDAVTMGVSPAEPGPANAGTVDPDETVGGRQTPA